MATDLVVPALGESISEAVISRWLKKVGEQAAADEPVVDLETDKISVQLPAPAAGVITEHRFPEGATVRVGDIIGQLAEGAVAKGAPAAPAPKAVEAPKAVVAAAPAPKATPAPVATSAPVAGAAHVSAAPVLSPARRRALREKGAAALATSPAAGTSVPAPTVAGPREEVVQMTPLRRRIAERLVEAQHTAAILTTFNEVDMSNVMALRAKYQEQFVAKHGIKLGLMSFFVRAAIASLIEFPGLNAEIRGSEVLYKKHYDLGIAVGGGRGLVVPVLRNADELSFAEIEKAIGVLATRAKDNKLTLEDLTGGTFTITNGGIYGSMMSTPLLNMPQTGILGMHNIINRPVGVGDQIELRPMMYLALSYDHRIVDGREAVQFLIGIKQRVENPDRLLFEV